MGSDDIERQMAFILEQQAKFSADIAKLEEERRKMEEEMKEEMRVITGKIHNLADALLSLTNIVERHDQQIAALIEQGKETDRRFKETDERLNAMITVLERLISDKGTS